MRPLRTLISLLLLYTVSFASQSDAGGTPIPIATQMGTVGDVLINLDDRKENYTLRISVGGKVFYCVRHDSQCTKDRAIALADLLISQRQSGKQVQVYYEDRPGESSFCMTMLKFMP